MTRQISLNGTWHYEPRAHVTIQPGGVLAESTDDLPAAGEMTLPANWELAGLENFHGRVQFRRRFAFDGLRDTERRVFLVFRAVDYFARVWLNGVLLGDHAGYFQPFRFDVTEQVHEGDNELVVDVTCPLEEPGTVWPNHKLLIKGILSHWDCRPGSWHPEHGQDRNSGGIWNDVYLETLPEAYLGQARITTKLVPRDVPPGFFAIGIELDPDQAKQAAVAVDTEIFGPPGEYSLRVRLGDEPAVSLQVTVTEPGERHTVLIEVREPRLWWTWDLGEPHLESCVIELLRGEQLVHRKQLEVGLREIEFDPQNGQWQLNGERVFLRGTNVVPTLWLGEYDEAMIGRDVELLLAAHVNAVRVCVHVNRDEFYSACDRAGLLVWQDFALQWSYAETQEFVHEAVRQIGDMVRLLRNHPCIGIWCCQNESSFHNKYVLDPQLAAAVAAEDGSRPIRATSEFQEHTYPGWYHGHYRDYSALPGTPTLTEFGAQALPDLDSLRKMVGDQWPPDWNALGYHDFQYDQTFHGAGVEMGQSWEEFVSNSQAYQARLLKYSLEQYRQAKYRELGCMFQFMFMDCWPSITWSVLSYERVAKEGYRVLQQCYQPILIGANLWRQKLMLGDFPWMSRLGLWVDAWVVNDLHRELEDCRYEVHIVGPGGELHFESEELFDVPADGVLAQAPRVNCGLPADLAPGLYRLDLELKQDRETLSRNAYQLEVVSAPAMA